MHVQTQHASTHFCELQQTFRFSADKVLFCSVQLKLSKLSLCLEQFAVEYSNNNNTRFNSQFPGQPR